METVTVTLLLPGCSYDHDRKEFHCGEHGVCKTTELNKLLVMRYCVCDRGYSGTETCNKPCDDCCQQLADQCYSKRVTAHCRVPRCLSKALSNRKCPVNSPSRKEMNERMLSYLSVCKRKARA
ncbi:uncharacterized protein [Watersipora subatra]|uniref:uncharacterized protein n=1 Tax=Watersipora subatra TaxID=2589382 RepID=UPI00355B6843